MKEKNLIYRNFKWILLSILIGLLAGMGAYVFLYFLEKANFYFQSHHDLLFLLPLAGLLIGWVYHKYGKDSHKGTHLILEEIHDPKKVLPLRMAPFILFSTVLTHLTGGSAGREGTAVQIGASLSDQLSRVFKVPMLERKILLVAGTSAGFGAALGAPIAGAIFGMEVLHIGKFKAFAVLECFIASFVSYYTAQFLGAPHSQYPQTAEFLWDFKVFFLVLFSGVLFGLVVRFFITSTHLVESLLNRWIPKTYWQPFFMGLVLVALFHIEGSFRFNALGLEMIQNSFQNPVSLEVPLLKSLFTSLTIGSGFKGGEFIPLVYVGSTLGNCLAQFFSLSLPLFASLGFVAVFAGASKTPITCTLLAMELFGYRIGPWAFLCCWCSYFFSGYKGIYKNQKNLKRSKYGKHHP